MFKAIKAAFAVIGIKTSDLAIKTTSTSTTIEDQSAINTRKRIDKLFEQQQTQLQSRALVPHAFDCDDPVLCMKSKCFKWEPDKIVSSPYKINLKKD